ncbi:MAG TPA: IS1 family transposase [Thermoanaerobaculia bacterium]
MNKLSPEKRARIIQSLVEGNSIASTCRMTGAAKMTVLSLLAEVGEACLRFHDTYVRYLNTERLQCDEVWSFCYAKEKNVPRKMRDRDDVGSVWTWTALDADSKLLVSWLVSERNQEAADALIEDIKSRTFRRIQISTDGRSEYLGAIVKAFSYGECDYAEVIKQYGPSGNQPGSSPNSAESRYSPGRVTGIEKRPKVGMPITKHISTSYMERWNLTLRMQNRRFTRLTNAFSKNLQNHIYMLALTVVFYNFCRKHKSLGGKTPAMVAGLTDYRWTASDVVALDMWLPEEKAA